MIVNTSPLTLPQMAITQPERELRPPAAAPGTLFRRAAARVWRARTPLALALILAAGLALRLRYFYGVIQWDPLAYADSAYSVAHWQPVFDPDIVGSLFFTQYIRLPLVLPAALLYRVFGANDATSTAFPIALSLAMPLFAFLIARRVSGELSGLAAAYLVAIFPVLAANSTQFLPDTVQAGFMAAALVCFLRAFEAEPPGRRRALLYFTTGLCWALAFYARPSAAGMALPIGALVLVRRRFHRELLAGIPGALVVVLAFNVLLISLGAGFLEDLRVIRNEGTGSGAGALSYTDLDWTYRNTLLTDRMFWPFTVVALGGVAITVARLGPRRALSGLHGDLLVLAIGLYVYFEFLMRLPTLYSWWKEPRYILSLEFVLLTLAGIGAGNAFAWAKGNARYGVVGLAAVASLSLAAVSYETIDDDRAFLRDHRVDAVAVHVAEFLDANPPPSGRVLHWNSDLALTLAYRWGLDHGTVYEQRIAGRSDLLPRFDAEGHSQAGAGDYVVLLAGENWWSRPTVAAAHWELVHELPGQAQVYLVPEQPKLAGNRFVLSDPVELPRGVTITSVTLSKSWAAPEEHIAALIEFAHPVPAATLEVTPCDLLAPYRRYDVPEGATRLIVEMSMDVRADPGLQSCMMMAGMTDGGVSTMASLVGIKVPLIASYQPEEAFTVDRNDPSNHGWYRFNQPYYETGGSAVAVAPFAPLRVPIPEVERGSYWVELAVFDYGSGENAVRVTLNGVSKELRWSREAPGMTHVKVAVPDVPFGGSLEVLPLFVGQEALVIDAVVLTTIEPPE